MVNLTEYEINAKEYAVEYDLDNRMNKAEVGGEEVEQHRRLVGVLDEARRVSSREATTNQYRYDAMGRRVFRKVGSTTTALIWWANLLK